MPEPSLPGGGRLGEFRLLREIGRGSGGVVYEAEQASLGRHVALKVLAVDAGDRRRVERFLGEARAVAQLSHPGIVAVYTAGEDAGLLYFAMELVGGRDLGRLIAASGPLPAPRAAAIAADVARALAHAHARGITHRDIKPDNILLGDDGLARIADFGLARLRDDGDGSGAYLVGTPAFMAPEQARGAPATPQSDVYGLGAVLFAMLAGRAPYAGDEAAAVLARLVSGPPPPLSAELDVPPALRAICERAMARTPAARYPSAEALGADLEAIAPARPGPPPPASVAAPTPSLAGSPRRPPWLPPLGVAAGLVVLALAAAGTWPRGGGGDRRPVAMDASDAAGPAALAPVATDVAASARLPARWLRLEPRVTRAYPALAADGRRLAVAERSDSMWQIVLRELSGGEPRMIGAPAEHAHLVAMSPATADILYSSDADGLLWTSADGATRPVSTQLCAHPALTADGKSAICVARFSTVLVPGTFAAPLRLVDLATGGERILTSWPASSPTWAPSGERVAFVAASGGGIELFAMTVDGRAPQPQTADGWRVWSPQWPRPGDRIYYGTDRDRRIALAAVPPGPSAPGGHDERLDVGFLAGEFYLSMALDGSRAAITGWELDNLYRLDLNAADPRPTRIRSTVFGVAAPTISPDGRHIVFASGATLQSVGTDGSGLRELLDDRYRSDAPRWSPDGVHIVFRAEQGGGPELWLLELDGATVRQLTDTGGRIGSGGVWSADGQRLAYAVAGDGTHVLPVQAADRSERLPVPAGFVPTSWSADGRWLAGHDSAGIVLFDFVSREHIRPTEAGSFPAWLPDGDRLLYVVADRIELLDLTQGERRIVFDAAPSRLRPELCVHPDGHTILFSAYLPSDDVALVELVP